MGSGQSTRTLTVSNDEDTGVIKVSEDIVQRLAKKSGDSGKVRAPAASPPQDASNQAESNLTGLIYAPGYTISALEMQQIKAKELAAQDQYWQKRLQNLEKNHKRINEILDEEYKKAIEEFTDNKGLKESIAKNSVPPCLDKSKEIIKCYNDHPKEVLQCSNLVEEFANCVDQRRARVVAARC